MYSLLEHSRLKAVCHSVDVDEVLIKVKEITTMNPHSVFISDYKEYEFDTPIRKGEVLILINPLSELPKHLQKSKVVSLREKDFWIYFEEKPLVIKKKDWKVQYED